MIKSNTVTNKKKKKGFTLVELIAVIAIIGILAAVLVPKVTGYINEARKTAVIDQARKVVTAAESVTIKLNLGANPTTIADVITKSGGLIVADDVKNLIVTDGIATTLASVADCVNILDSEKYTFTVNSKGGFSGIDVIPATPETPVTP